MAQVTQNIRYAYIEEIDRSKLDVANIKDFTSGEKINNEVMFGTSKDVEINCKLNLISNNSINFDTDSGIARRGLHETLDNKFMPKSEYDQEVKKRGSDKGLYLRDSSLPDLLKTIKWKIAVCHILFPYAKMYYDQGLTCSDRLKNSFKEVCNDNDQMAEFIKSHYEITGNPKEKVHKDLFVEHYRSVTGLKMISWINILNDVKRLGLNYQKNLSSGGLQGVLVGIKLKPRTQTVDDEEDDDINAEEDVKPVVIVSPKALVPAKKTNLFDTYLNEKSKQKSIPKVQPKDDIDDGIESDEEKVIVKPTPKKPSKFASSIFSLFD